MYKAMLLHPNDQPARRIAGRVYFWTIGPGGKLKLNPALDGDKLHPELINRLAEMN